MELPKYKKSNQTGRKGLTIISKIIENQLDWLLRANHQEDDFGIDAFIDIIDSESITGKSIAIQVKTGQSYLKEFDEFNWLFEGEFRHLNYYLNHDIPVLIVLVDDQNEIAYWEVCKPEYTSREADHWTLLIPKNQLLNAESKETLRKYVSPNVDYVTQLENYWDTNKMLSDSGHLMLIAGKEDIINLNYDPLIDFMSRVCSNKLLLNHLRERIEIGIHGYNDENRELHEIEEVRTWVRQIFYKVPGLTYFLTKHEEYSHFLKLFMFCIIDFEIVPGCDIYVGKILRKKVSFDSKELLKVFSILFSDLNDFTKAFNIDVKVNERISKNMTKLLAGEEFPGNGE